MAPASMRLQSTRGSRPRRSTEPGLDLRHHVVNETPPRAAPSPHETPEISVVVVGYRSERHIGSCLDSLASAADGLSFEAIVVDNSPDELTAEVVRVRAPLARVERTGANLGFARAANLGVRRARGRAVLFLNPDARLEAGSLRRLWESLRSSSAPAAVGPTLVDASGRPAVSARPGHGLGTILFESLMFDRLFPSSPWVVRGSGGLEPVAVPCLSGACLLVDHASFEALGGFDERFFLYGEDVDLCFRARQSGRALVLVPAARAIHEEASSSRLDPARFQLDLHRAKWQLIDKHERGARRLAAMSAFRLGLLVRTALHLLEGLLGRPGALERARHEWAALDTIRREARVSEAAAGLRGGGP